MHVAIQIADAVVLALNEESFSRPFTAVRAWRPERTAQEMEDLQVIVIPVLVGIVGHDRQNDQHDYTVEVGLFKKIDASDPEAVDPWVDFAEEVTDRLRAKGGIQTPRAAYIGIENDPVVSEEHLQRNIFASLITVTYRLRR